MGPQRTQEAGSPSGRELIDPDDHFFEHSGLRVQLSYDLAALTSCTLLTLREKRFVLLLFFAFCSRAELTCVHTPTDCLVSQCRFKSVGVATNCTTLRPCSILLMYERNNLVCEHNWKNTLPT